MKIPIHDQITKFVQAHNLISWGDKILLGVSGGADSMALMILLNELKHEWGITLHIAHYDHNLRKDSYKDQTFVAEQADQLQLPFTSEKCLSKATARKGSLEEFARKKRFTFLIKTAKKQQATKIALAHTADDLSETVLMRLIRGTGLQGLRSIRPCTVINDEPFIRPFLFLSKETLLKFLKERKQPYRTDPTNTQKIYFRNKVRLELIPLLQNKYNSNIKQILCNLSNTLSIDYDYIETQAEKTFQNLRQKSVKRGQVSLALDQVKEQHPAIQRIVFRKAICFLKGDTLKLTFKHMQEIETLITEKPAQSVVDLPHKISVKKWRGNLIFFKD